MTGARVQAVVNPAFGLTVRLADQGRGTYSGRLRKDNLPKMYDYEARRYVTLSGPITLDVTARRGPQVGAVRVAAEL